MTAKICLTHLGSQALESRWALRHFYKFSFSVFFSKAGARNTSQPVGLGHHGDVDTKDQWEAKKTHFLPFPETNNYTVQRKATNNCCVYFLGALTGVIQYINTTDNIMLHNSITGRVVIFKIHRRGK